MVLVPPKNTVTPYIHHAHHYLPHHHLQTTQHSPSDPHYLPTHPCTDVIQNTSVILYADLRPFGQGNEEDGGGGGHIYCVLADTPNLHFDLKSMASSHVGTLAQKKTVSYLVVKY